MNTAKQVKVGATPGKIALVAVLGVVLAWVLASNFRGAPQEVVLETPDAAAGALATTATAVGGDGRTEPSASPFGEFAVAGDWPAVDLDRLILFDPLAEPQWLDSGGEGAVADAPPAGQSLEELQNATNAIIFVTGDERVAHIGSQEYRVGDTVGQFQIIDISSAGIVLSPPDGASPTAD